MSDILLAYQENWAKDTSNVKVWEKSRRIGASYGEALLSVLEASKSREAGGQNTYYLSYNKEMTQGFIHDCAYWAKIINVACSEIEEITEKIKIFDEDKDITVYKIRFASGFEIWGMPSEPRSLRSKQGRVILDEAAFVDDLSEVLKAAHALTMWGGSVSIISTHNGEDNQFNELIKDIRAGRKPYSLHRTTLDDALADGFYKKICEKRGLLWSKENEEIWRVDLIAEYGEGADEELFCVPSKSNGAFLTSNLIESCMHDNIPVIHWINPADDFVDWEEEKDRLYTKGWLYEHINPYLAAIPKRSCFIGQDFGRSGDLTVIWLAFEKENCDLETAFVLEIRNCPHRTQEQIFSFIADNVQFAGASLDARGNGSAMAEFARQKYGTEHIAEVMITEKWYRETMPKLKARLEDKTVTIPQNADIKNDLRSLKMVKGVAKILDTRTKDSSGKRHGDAAIALGMLMDAHSKFQGTGSLLDMETIKYSKADRFNFDSY